MNVETGPGANSNLNEFVNEASAIKWSVVDFRFDGEVDGKIGRILLVAILGSYCDCLRSREVLEDECQKSGAKF